MIPTNRSRLALYLLVASLVMFTGLVPVSHAAGLSHVVQPGETLETIARRYGTSPAAIVALNQLAAPHAVTPGQRLSIFETESTASAAPVPGVHIAASGETLEAVARRHGLGLDVLAGLNGLDQSGVLQPGQALRLAGPEKIAPPPGTAFVEPEPSPVRVLSDGALAWLNAPGQGCSPQPAAGESLVAQVKDWAIGQAAYEQRWNQVVLSLSSLGVDVWASDFQATEPRARRSVLDLMIDEVLVQQWATAQGVVVDPAEVQARQDEAVAAAGGLEAFQGWLEKTGQTWLSFQQALCHDVLDAALVANIVGALPGPVPRDKALARWLQAHRATTRIEVFADVAQVAALPAEPGPAPNAPWALTPSFLVPPEH